MTDVKRQFAERTEEIEKYFTLLEYIMVKSAKMVLPDNTQIDFDTDTNKILRANAFLLLYNVVESSISQAIEAIHIDIESKGVSFNDITDEVKACIYKHVKGKIKHDDFLNKVNDIAIDIIKFYPDRRNIFSGNVDAKKIREISQSYGFSHQTNSSLTRGGSDLLTVKTNRNDLAHGFRSFLECGKDYSIQDVIQIKDQVVAYVNEIILNIEDFLVHNRFKK